MHMIFIYIVRELSKLFMFAALWGFPMFLSATFHSPAYLWFFALSFIGTLCMFSHFEVLERIDNIAEEEEPKDE